MLEPLVALSLRYKVLVLIIFAVIGFLGFQAVRQLPIDAFPDVTPVQVNVYTEASGLAAEDVELLLTTPVESALAGLPKVEQIRSVSLFGLSYVSVYFNDGMDIYFARQLVNERLQQVGDRLLGCRLGERRRMADARHYDRLEAGQLGLHPCDGCRRQEVGQFTAQNQHRPAFERAIKRPQVGNTAIGGLQRFGNLHIVIERNAAIATNHHHALGEGEPVADCEIGVRAAGLLAQMARGVHPGLEAAALADIVANALDTRRLQVGTDIVEHDRGDRPGVRLRHSHGDHPAH